VIVASLPGLLLISIKRFGFREIVQALPECISEVKAALIMFFNTVKIPANAKDFDAILRQTPFNYSIGSGKKGAKEMYLTEYAYKNILLIESTDFKTVVTSKYMQQKQAEFTLTSGPIDWATQKIKTSSIMPFHCSSTTTDVSTVLPQFKQLTHDEKLVMPSMGVEWWSELMQTEAYKKFFGFETGGVHHVHASKLDNSRAVRSYADICNGL
jgi:hypothetical protein